MTRCNRRTSAKRLTQTSRQEADTSTSLKSIGAAWMKGGCTNAADAAGSRHRVRMFTGDASPERPERAHGSPGAQRAPARRTRTRTARLPAPPAPTSATGTSPARAPAPARGQGPGSRSGFWVRVRQRSREGRFVMNLIISSIIVHGHRPHVHTAWRGRHGSHKDGRCMPVAHLPTATLA